jgi:hypothetical protein
MEDLVLMVLQNIPILKTKIPYASNARQDSTVNVLQKMILTRHVIVKYALYDDAA